jgi:hypothetical protein
MVAIMILKLGQQSLVAIRKSVNFSVWQRYPEFSSQAKLLLQRKNNKNMKP